MGQGSMHTRVPVWLPTWSRFPTQSPLVHGRPPMKQWEFDVGNDAGADDLIGRRVCAWVQMGVDPDRGTEFL